jgi:hypothetical protein
MFALLHSLGMFGIDLFKPGRRLEVENLFLRHQLSIALRRAPPHSAGCLPTLLVQIQVLRPVVPENSTRRDSRGEAESAHHPLRCLRLSTSLQRL